MRTNPHVLVTKDGAVWRCPRPYLAKALKQGWEPVDPTEVSASERPFNPDDHTVEAVNAYLADHADDEVEVARVVALEDAGQKRTTVTRPDHNLDNAQA